MFAGRTARALSVRGSAVVAAALLASLLTSGTAPRWPIVATDLAVAGGYRSVEPRLSFLASHAVFRPVSAQQRIATLLKHRPKSLVEAQALAVGQQQGLMQLLLGDATKAIGTLSRPDVGADAGDLAAAYYTRGLSSAR